MSAQQGGELLKNSGIWRSFWRLLKEGNNEGEEEVGCGYIPNNFPNKYMVSLYGSHCVVLLQNHQRSSSIEEEDPGDEVASKNIKRQYSRGVASFMPPTSKSPAKSSISQSSFSA